jgi:putative transposase
MLCLDKTSPILLNDGITYQFVGESGGMIRLRSDADGEYSTLHIAEFSSRIPVQPEDDFRSPATFAHIPKKVRKNVLSLAEHLDEVLTGIHPDFDTPRPQYDPAVHSQNARRDAKLVEFRELGTPMSTATFARKLKTYREQGAAGLIDGRSLRKDGPLGAINDEFLDALTYVMANQKDRSTGSRGRLIKEARARVVKEYGMNVIPVPSESSMYRYIKALDVNQHTTGSAKTRRSLANRPDLTFTSRTATLPGAEVQVDSTTLDMFVRTSNGKAERPILTILFDKATRCIIAHTIRFTATRGVDHVALLAQALVPPQNRPDKTEFRAFIQRMNPQITLLSANERKKLELDRPFIRPRTILMDNGRDYVGAPFIAALQKFKIDALYSPPHTPTTKANVERNFGSMNSLFAQHQPGYTGNSPENRGYKVENQDLMDVYALHELFDDWVLKVWNTRRHGGLRDRVYPSLKLTPVQMYKAAAALTSTFELPLTRHDYIELLPSHYRVITSTGIRIHGRDLDSAELHPLRNIKSSDVRNGRKWEVKIDPYNPSVAWVRSPENNWIEIRLRTADFALYPHLEDMELSAKEQERIDLATISAAVSGTPIHLPLDALVQPTTASTDDDTPVALPLFDEEMDFNK